jgi:CBS domain-containing protein
MSERRLQHVIGSNVLTVTQTTSVLEAARAMAKVGCGSALVVDAAGRLEGIVTERDVMVRAVAKDVPVGKTAVSQIMTANPYCAKPEMPVTHALLIMKERGFRHIPVLDAAGLPLGVFSLRDAMPDELTGAEALQDAYEHLSETLG